MAKSIMIQGTMSGAGKSMIVTALCRIFKQDGYKVAPFKSQNMALNSFITSRGLEMGRAQVVQAQAAGAEPDVRMNPVLLKPTGDVKSQVIVAGKVYGNYSAWDYYDMKKELIPEIKKAYDSLAAENDIIVIEGAGSPAEINLSRATDAAETGEEVNVENLKKGIEMINQETVAAMGKHGLEPIETEGKMFDPNFHEAVMQTPTSDKEENTNANKQQDGSSDDCKDLFRVICQAHRLAVHGLQGHSHLC